MATRRGGGLLDAAKIIKSNLRGAELNYVKFLGWARGVHIGTTKCGL